MAEGWVKFVCRIGGGAGAARRQVGYSGLPHLPRRNSSADEMSYLLYMTESLNSGDYSLV